MYFYEEETNVEMNTTQSTVNETCDDCIYDCEWRENRNEVCERFKDKKLFGCVSTSKAGHKK